ncbi:hypothetical protein C8R43DRAFT_193721 [Mycena crocata]|nr:hypothetical protein C8R43DRAFT_193721 [Mycena crocata]
MPGSVCTHNQLPWKRRRGPAGHSLSEDSAMQQTRNGCKSISESLDQHGSIRPLMETISGDLLVGNLSEDPRHPAESISNIFFNLKSYFWPEISTPRFCYTQLLCMIRFPHLRIYSLHVQFSLRLRENSNTRSISVPKQGPRLSSAVGGVWCRKRKSRVLK